MAFRRNKRKIFCSGRISEVFQRLYTSIISTIAGENESYVLGVNITDYVEHVKSRHKLEVPEIHFDQVFADSYEDDIPAEYFPFSFAVDKGRAYKKEVIQYFIPCSGNIDLLNYSPALILHVGGGGDFEVRGNNLVTEFINFSNDAEEIIRKFEYEKNGLMGNYRSLKADIENFNASLQEFVISNFNQRKQKILDKKSLLSSLGVPVRKKDAVAETFSVPNPKLREKIVVKPVVTEKNYIPEPSLDDSTYRKILKLINDVGKNFERMPSLYKGKDEETLRDHIIMTLDPNFEYGSASGETFNKAGKTDVLLRYESSVVFIAECKFWRGEKSYLSTITQLLGYLTWRDTKASIIVFVTQKDFSSILNKIESETISHSNYLGFIDKSDENWFNYRFHINGDRNREVRLAVQLFHLPEAP